MGTKKTKETSNKERDSTIYTVKNFVPSYLNNFSRFRKSKSSRVDVKTIVHRLCALGHYLVWYGTDVS